MAFAILGLATNAQAFVETSFRHAASSAPIIALVDAEKGKEGTLVLKVVKMIRGEPHLNFTFARRYRYKNYIIPGFTYLLLLQSESKLFETANQCGTNNALQILDGKVVNPYLFDNTRFDYNLYSTASVVSGGIRLPVRHSTSSVIRVDGAEDLTLEEVLGILEQDKKIK